MKNISKTCFWKVTQWESSVIRIQGIAKVWADDQMSKLGISLAQIKDTHDSQIYLQRCNAPQ